MHDFLDPSDFMDNYVTPFEVCNWHYEFDRGYIVWRPGTGGNTELLHVRTFKPGKGIGRGLVYAMLDRLRDTHPPYHSVYGFTRTSNEDAQKFYGALGFRLAPAVEGLYAEGGATLFWAPYAELVANKRGYEIGQAMCRNLTEDRP